ncbi:hypothetical protein ACLBXM_07470 [Xanthobacteraceae bacterium A53D]
MTSTFDHHERPGPLADDARAAPVSSPQRQAELAEERVSQAETVRHRMDRLAVAEQAMLRAPLWLRWLMRVRLTWSRDRLTRAKNSAGAHRVLK